MRIHLRSLLLAAFRSIRDRAEFQFPERGLCRIHGQNLDTGGSSAAGKSGVGLGIAHALGFCPFPGTELQCWDTDEKYEVRLDLHRDDGQDLDIIRRPTGVSVGGEKMSKPATTKLRTYLGGAEPELLRVLTYAQQDDFQDFLQLEPKQRYEFLAQMFPELGVLESVGVQASKAAAASALQLEVLRPQMTQLAQQMAEATGRLQSCGNEEPIRLEMDRLRDLEAGAKASCEVAKAATAEARAGVEKRMQDLREKRLRAQAQVDAAEKTLLAEVARLDEEAKPRLAGAEAQVAKARQALQEHQRGGVVDPGPPQSEAYQKMKQQLQQAEHHLAKVQGDYDRARAVIQAQRVERAAKLAQTRAEIQKRKSEEVEVRRLVKDLAVLKGNKCPTCLQVWDKSAGGVEACEARIATLSASLAQLGVLELEAEDLALPIADAPAPPVLAKLVEIQDQVRAAMRKMEADARQAVMTARQQRGLALSDELQVQQTALDGLREELVRARAELLRRPKDDFGLGGIAEEAYRVQAQAIPDFGLPEAERQLDAVRRQITGLEAKIVAQQLARESATRELAQVQKQVAELREKVEALEGNQRVDADVGELLSPSGFLSALFQEILEEISRETNAILQQVANTAEVSVAFVSESTTAGGKTVRGIRAQATIRGHEASLRSGASGGMYTAIRLAVRLAVRAVASRRTGVYPAWLVLDEPFNGLGPVEKEACMEILKIIAEKDLVLIIDHGSEFQDLFDQQFTLVLEKGVTRVRS